MTRPLALAGRKFHRLTVLDRQGSRDGKATWNCICECGTEKVVAGTELMTGGIRSCGCLRKEGTTAFLRKINTRHGMHRTPEYKAWISLRQRCENSRDKSFCNYGGRGIRVCERWQVFENFFADMGKRPTKHHSLDRTNNDGDYEPDNCTWATKKHQATNRRKPKQQFLSEPDMKGLEDVFRL